MEYVMDDQFSRNFFYINDELQKRISKVKVAFLGVGLSSTICEIMVRTGFSDLFLCDGDLVEKSNLNRQNFVSSDIGQSKVLVMQKRLKDINQNITCQILPERIQSLDQIRDILDQTDIIILTFDSSSLYFDIIDLYRKKGKLVICPFNPGFGGLAICFTESSCSSYEFFETQKPSTDIEQAQILMKRAKGIGKEYDQFFKSIFEKGYFPQLAIGSAITGALVTTAALKFLKNEKIVTAPNINWVSSQLEY